MPFLVILLMVTLPFLVLQGLPTLLALVLNPIGLTIIAVIWIVVGSVSDSGRL